MHVDVLFISHALLYKVNLFYNVFGLNVSH